MLLPAPDLPDGPRSALVVATGSYTDPGLADLRAPARDAAEMIDLLGDDETGGFAVTPVLDRPHHEIREALGEFLTGRRPRDTILLYLSCHGVLSLRGELYFAAVDTSRDRPAYTGIEASWLRDRLDECDAGRQVLILDCCFSGSFPGAKAAAGLDLERRLIGAGRGRDLITASRAGEYSFEGEPLPGAEVARSVFTAALVDGIRSGDADANRDGLITVEEAYYHAAGALQAAASRQNPQYVRSSGEGKIVLARNPRGVPVAPAAIPEALQLSLHSPYPDVRVGAVTTLGGWLAATDPAMVLAARPLLRKIADEDIPAVARAAAALLGADDRPAPDRAAGKSRARQARAAANPEPVRRGTPENAGAAKRDPLTIRLVSRSWNVLDHQVLAVAFSPSGQSLATGADDRKVRLWNPDTGRLVRNLAGHTDWVWSVAFSPDGLLVAGGGHDRTVRLWTARDGTPVRTLRGHTAPVFAVAFSPDGKLLASGGGDNQVCLWRAATGELVRTLTGVPGSPVSVAFSPGGALLARASKDALQLWNPATGEHVRGSAGAVRPIAFSPDGTLLATGSQNNDVHVWTAANGDLRHTLAGHTGAVRCLAFHPSGTFLASGSTDHTVRLWNPATGHHLRTIKQTSTVNAVAVDPRGDRLATGNVDNTVRLWRV